MRLDLSTVIGISAALVAVFLSMVNFPYIDMSKIVVFWDPPALLIVFGGGVGSWMACFPFSDIKLTPKVVLKAWFAKDEDPCALIKRMVEFAEIARRDGILALENVTSTIQDPFLVTGIQLAVDGTDPELIEDILETEMHGMEERHMVGKRLIDIFIRNSPSFGMVGTLIGMVIMFSSGVSNPEALTKAMAIALCATLYGALCAYLIGSPVSDKLWRRNMEEQMMKKIIVRGVMSIQAGDNPRIVERKLIMMLPPVLRAGMETKDKK